MWSWLYKAEYMDFSIEFPPILSDYNDNVESHTRFLMETVQSDQTSVDIPDLRHMDILDRRMLVSHKWTTQLFNLASLWKKIVLKKHTNPELGNAESIHLLDQPHSGPSSPPGPSIPARFCHLWSGKMINLNNNEFSVQRRFWLVSPLVDEDTRNLLAETLLQVCMPWNCAYPDEKNVWSRSDCYILGLVWVSCRGQGHGVQYSRVPVWGYLTWPSCHTSRVCKGMIYPQWLVFSTWSPLLRFAVAKLSIIFG